MDLDFDLEDPLLEYVGFEDKSGNEFLISRYLLNKLECERHYVESKFFFNFNQALFSREDAVNTLKTIFDENFDSFWPYDCTWLSTTLATPAATFYSDSPHVSELYECPDITIVIANKFQEIHAIGTSDLNLISRPAEMIEEEESWTEPQKFAHDNIFRNGFGF